MNQKSSLYFDATSGIFQNSTCSCSDCDTAFCVSKREHDTNQRIKCKDCDAVFGSEGNSLGHSAQIANSFDMTSSTKSNECSDKLIRIGKDRMETTNKSPCEQSYKSISGGNIHGQNFPKNPELQTVQSYKKDDVDNIDDFRNNLSTTTAQLSAQIMNLSYREFKESISQDQTEKVSYSTNDILQRIKEAYDACSCKICECFTGQSVLSRTNNCARSPCDCEPCSCKDCQVCSNVNNELLDIGLNPRLNYIQKANTILERLKEISNRDNQSYTCNPCNCEPCRCKDCNKDLMNVKNDHPVRYITRTNTALERLKNGFNKLNDNSADTYNCNCEPCECKDCKMDRLNIAIDARIKGMKRTNKEAQQVNGEFVSSANCNCKPCDCIQCAKLYRTPCDCKPCECYDCKSMRGLGKKTVIVAPMEEGPQRANCLCAPCDCARCSHRGLNLSPNRVHEMSTGINRHPNCHCEACVNDACEPNGTGSCRCEGRHGVISKPVENNPHDFDIRRATVSSKPLKTLGNTFVRNTYVAMNMNKFPSGNGRDADDKQHCKCSVCECIVCICKGNDLSRSSHNLNDSLKTLKLPSRELRSCQCAQCECQKCAFKKQGNLAESKELKRCTCEICDCIHCEGELKPIHTLSKLIPVKEIGSKYACRCKPCQCNDCRKMEAARKFDTCHCDFCRCERCSDDANASQELLYPIKKGEILTPSMIRKDPLSEPELLRQSSEYTQIKHSVAQSNVFNSSKLPERSQQHFSIYHMVSENNINKTLNHTVTTYHMDKREKNDCQDTKSKNKGVKILDPTKENHLSRNNGPSTSGSLPKRELSIIRINTISNHLSNDNNKDFESPFFEDMVAISKISRTPSLQSIPQSAHNLVYLTPTCVSYDKPSNVSFSTPNGNSENSVASRHSRKEINVENDSTKTKQSRCHHCGSTSTKSEIVTSNGITQTLLNLTNFNGYNSDFEDPLLKYLLPDHSKDLQDYSPPKYLISDNNGAKHGLIKKYYTLRLENPNTGSYGGSNVDDLIDSKTENLPTGTYERALITLKRAKVFSLELVTLLQKYDKANMEFQSITKKLKQSHEAILNDFKNDVCGRVGVKEDVNYLTRVLFSTSEQRLVNANHKDSSHYKDLKELKNFAQDRKPITTSMINSLCAKQMNMIENQESEKITDLTSKTSQKETISNASPKKGSIADINEKAIKSSPSAYRAYKKLVERSASVVRKLKQKKSPTAKHRSDDKYDVTPSSVPAIEAELLKKIIRQEVHSILKEFNETNNPMLSASYSSGEHKSKHDILEKEKPVNINKSHRKGTVENKPMVKGSIMYANQHATKDVSKSPSPTQQSSSHRRHIALERLQNEVKELLNLAILQSTSTRQILNSPKETDLVRSHSRSEPGAQLSTAVPAVPEADVKKTEEAVQIKAKESQRQTVDSTIPITSKNPIRAPSASTHNKEKCSCEALKASFEGLRRVSDHTVMVKWQAPLNIDDIKGFEVLVDGRPMEKAFGPADRVAVVTCLPHSERVQLGVRTVPRRALTCGHRPCATLLYRPRRTRTVL